VIPEGPEDLSGKNFLIWVVSSSGVKGSMKRGWVCGSERLCLYRSVAGENQFRLFLVVWGKFVVEEVVTQGESVAAPVQRVEGSKPAFPYPDSGISGCVGASFRW